MSWLGDSDDGPISPTWHWQWCYLPLAKAAAVTRLVPMLALLLWAIRRRVSCRTLETKCRTPVLQKSCFLRVQQILCTCQHEREKAGRWELGGKCMEKYRWEERRKKKKRSSEENIIYEQAVHASAIGIILLSSGDLPWAFVLSWGFTKVFPVFPYIIIHKRSTILSQRRRGCSGNVAEPGRAFFFPTSWPSPERWGRCQVIEPLGFISQEVPLGDSGDTLKPSAIALGLTKDWSTDESSSFSANSFCATSKSVISLLH